MLLRMELRRQYNYPSRDLGQTQLYTAVSCGTICPRHSPNQLSREACPSCIYLMLLQALILWCRGDKKLCLQLETKASAVHYSKVSMRQGAWVLAASYRQTQVEVARRP